MFGGGKKKKKKDKLTALRLDLILGTRGAPEPDHSICPDLTLTLSLVSQLNTLVGVT